MHPYTISVPMRHYECDSIINISFHIYFHTISDSTLLILKHCYTSITIVV